MSDHHQEPNEIDKALALIPEDDDTLVVRNEPGAVAELNRSELESQLDAAHRYPRSTRAFLKTAMTQATLTPAVAESCMYALPRGGKPIMGPSVRLAEIIASAYGNLHVGARPMEVGDKAVVSQGIAWDLERNFRVTIEVKRRITDNRGKRYNDDMVNVTHAAATSIAFRNAVFRVVPRAFVDQIYEQVKRVAVGDAKSLDSRRKELFERLAKLGVTEDRALAAVNKPSVDDVGLAELEMLIVFGTAVKQGDLSVDEAFPSPKPAAGAQPTDAPEGQRMSLRRKEQPSVPTSTDQKADQKADGKKPDLA